MLSRVIAWSIRHRAAVLVLTALLVVAGARAFATLPIDAVPDVTNVQVQVLTPAPALGAVDIERRVTAPVERALTGIQAMRELRSLSRPGISVVTAVFAEGTDLVAARQQVAERLVNAREEIPVEVGVPVMGPPTTGLGEVFQFELRGTSPDGRSQPLGPMDLRAMLEWDIAPRLRLVPGVVEVNIFGGALKTYELSIEPPRMRAYDVSVSEVVEALRRNHRMAGGGAIERGAEATLVRGDAQVGSLEELRSVVVARRGESVVRVGDLGEVRYAPMLRQGAASRDGRGEVVIGMAMMRIGENSRTVSRAVAEAVRDINRTLPRGARVEVFYDRTTLVDRTLRTVGTNLVEGGALVLAVLFLTLWNLRAGVIAAAMIPLCMLGAFVGMRALGLSGNLMSLGAIDFGLVVDGAIILLENAVFQLDAERRRLDRDLTAEERDRVVLDAALEVRGPTAYGEAIIALVYLPVLALEGIEGKMFGPMAWTVLFALATAFVLSLTFVPAMGSLILSRRQSSHGSPLMDLAAKGYSPLLRAAIGHPWFAVLGALAVLVASGVLASRLGTEFIPRLDEGALVVEVQRLPSVSLDESVRQAGVIERVLRRFPEVETVVSKTGRPEIANDPMGVEQSDVMVMLRPGAVRDREVLVGRMSRAIEEALPSAAFGFSQPIEMRTNELLSGTRADVAVRVYGEDLGTLSRLAERVSRALSRVPGAVDVRADRVEGLPVLRVRPDREALVRTGADIDDAITAVEALGGVTAGVLLDGVRRHPIRVRVAEGFRSDRESVEAIPVRAGGALVPLGSVARVETVDEPVVIQRESTERRVVVQANVRGRDLGGFVDEARRTVDAAVRRPPGYRLEWGGQSEHLESARRRLAVVVPLALAMILGLLTASFGRWGPALLIFVNVPFAATGGVLALGLRGMPLSISAGVGFIALFGVAVLNGLVLVSQVRHLLAEGVEPAEAAREGAMRRLRPVLTTALVASLGFVPMAMASGAGAEVQRPLATVVIGGLLSSTLLTLLVLPTLAARMGKWLEPAKTGGDED